MSVSTETVRTKKQAKKRAARKTASQIANDLKEEGNYLYRSGNSRRALSFAKRCPPDPPHRQRAIGVYCGITFANGCCVSRSAIAITSHLCLVALETLFSLGILSDKIVIGSPRCGGTIPRRTFDGCKGTCTEQSSFTMLQ